MARHLSAKAKAQYKKNKHQEMLFHLMRLRQAEASRVKEMEGQQRPKTTSLAPVGEWSDKVSRVRNRLTGKQRESKERWNRFAGTAESGGRGL